MRVFSEIARFWSFKVRRLLRLLRDVVTWPFDRKYRVIFRNFWLFGEEQRKIWFFPLIEDIYSKKNPKASCKISTFRPHIELFSVLGDRSRLEKSKALARVFFTGECVRANGPTDWSAYSDYRLDDVDLSLGFNFEESVGNPKYLRFPLWILYFFSGLETKDELAARIADLNNRNFSKCKFCAVVARHDANGIRAAMYNGLSTIDHVHSAGSWNRNDFSLVNDYKDDKFEYLKQFKFTICPENTQGEGYVTEKLFQAFQAGCIPIYNGYSSDPEPQVIDKNALIYWRENEDNEEALELVNRLHERVEEYKIFRNVRPFKESAVDFVWDSMQRLRSRLGDVLPVRSAG